MLAWCQTLIYLFSWRNNFYGHIGRCFLTNAFVQCINFDRYGREDLDVLGLTFTKDLYRASEQIFPVLDENKKPLSRLQVCAFYPSINVLFHTIF